jgi:hypothetical protein
MRYSNSVISGLAQAFKTEAMEGSAVFRKGFLAAAVFCVCFAVPVVLAGKEQRLILNFAPRGKLLPKGRSCPLGVKLSPMGEIPFGPPFF